MDTNNTKCYHSSTFFRYTLKAFVTRMFRLFFLLLFVSLSAGCAMYTKEELPSNKMIIFVAPENEEDTWISPLFKFRQNFDESLRYRQVHVAISPGGPFYNRILMATFSRVLDSVPHIEKGDLLMAAVPPVDEQEFDAGRNIMVVTKLLCKATNKSCLKEHDAPGRQYGKQIRWLEPGEYESYLKAENFSVYFTKDRQLIRPLP